MRIGSSTDKKDSGRIHVDFAQARDDLYEWECNQRLLAREERHRRKVNEDRLRPPSPPPIVHYSEHEAAMLADRLKGELDWQRHCHLKFEWHVMTTVWYQGMHKNTPLEPLELISASKCNEFAIFFNDKVQGIKNAIIYTNQTTTLQPARHQELTHFTPVTDSRSRRNSRRNHLQSEFIDMLPWWIAH